MSRNFLLCMMLALVLASPALAAERLAIKAATADVPALSGVVEGTNVAPPAGLDKLSPEAMTDTKLFGLLKVDVAKVGGAGGANTTGGSNAYSVFSGAGVRLTPALQPVRKLGVEVLGRILIAGQWPYGTYSLHSQNVSNSAIVRPGGIIGAEFFPGAEPGWTPAVHNYMIEIVAPGLPPGPKNVLVNGYNLPLMPAGAGRWVRTFNTAWPALCFDLRPTPTWCRLISVRLVRLY